MSESRLSHEPTRRHDLDWLRILAVLLLVPFHTALIFALDPKYVVYIKDQVQSDFLILVANFINLWHMPLLFVIAGMSTWFALHHRSASQYRTERLLRLLIPFVFGLVILIPPMTYIHLLGTSPSPPFLEYYLGFFRINPADLAGYNGTLTPAHLWFILYLFLFSMAALPLFLWLRSDAGMTFVTRWSSTLELPGMLLTFGLPLTLVSAIQLLGDKNPIYYLFIFICGCLLVVDPRFQKALDRDRWVYLLISLLATPVFFWSQQQYFPAWSVGWIGAGLLFHCLRWSWVLAILAMGYRCLNRNSAALRYCSEAAFPFYVLHMPINTIVGYLAIQWPVSIAVKYLSICTLTIALTLMTYEVLVHRTNILRFLFGMKSSTKPQNKRLVLKS